MIHDITRLLTPGHPTWPGDAPYRLNPGARISAGDSVNTGEIATSTHTGTHVDAPWHYDDTGARLDQMPLARYIGRCHVLSVVPERVDGDGLVPATALNALPDELPPRLLLNTGQAAHWETFPTDFTALAPEFVRLAAQRGVQLLGTDSPSVDPLTSKALPAHHACRETGILILEGLQSNDVPDGEYDLICLPMPLAGADGAPARVILLPAGTLGEG